MDPIFTPIFTTLLASAGLGASATTVGTILSGIVTTAIGVGLSTLTRPGTPPPENGSFAIQQALPPRIYAYGQCRVAGYIVFSEATYWYFQVSALVGHRCNKVVQFYLNDDLVYCNAGVSGSVYQQADGRYKNSAISLDYRLGADAETAYSQIFRNFPHQWDANHRGDKVCSLQMTCRSVASKDFTTVYPYQRPLPSAILETALIFDPRDPAQNPDDPNTFAYSTNPALAILHFQCFSPYGPQRNYHTAVEPVLDAWITEANICDEQVALKSGGTEKRYTLGGFTDTSKDPRSTLQTLLAACDGWFVERGDGTIGLTVGKYRTPTVVLTDDDITGFMFQTGMAAETSVNSIVATYSSAQDDFKTVETDPMEWVDDQVLRGRKNSGRLDLTWVQSTGQASRLQKREFIRNQEEVRGRLNLKLSGLNAIYERWILVKSSIPRLDGKVIENKKPTLSLMEGACTMEFIGSGAEIEVYDPATDESRPPTVITRQIQDGPPIPSNVNAAAKTVTGTDGSVGTYLVVSFDAPTYNDEYRYDITYVVHYRTAAAGSTPAGSWIGQTYPSGSYAVDSSGRIAVQTGLVPSNSTLDVAVSTIAGTGAESSYSNPIQVSTTASAAPTGPAQNLTASSGTGQVFLSCTNPNAATFAGVQFYRSAHGALFSTATKIGSEIFGSPNGTSAYTDTTAVAGTTYDYWVTAVNRSGTESTATGPAAGTAN